MKDLEFLNKEICVVNMPVKYDGKDLHYILCGALEGGIDYWGYLKQHATKPKGINWYVWCTEILLDGKHIVIGDVESDDEWSLTLENLIEGIKKNHIERPHSNKDNYDADDYDCIIQYALFDKLVFG